MKLNMKNFVRILAVSAAASPLSSFAAVAADNVTITTGATFVQPISVSVTQNLDFGNVSTNMLIGSTAYAGATFANMFTTAGNALGGSNHPAIINISSSPSQPMTLTISSVTNGAFYSLGAFKCVVGSDAAEKDCSRPINITPLLTSTVTSVRIGATMTKTTGVPSGLDSGSFNVTMTYQ
jgi:hypothetical protein